MSTSARKALVIVGPTASGKTAISLALATHFQTSIISADSRQCYREMNIGVAKPSSQELSVCKHYFINSHSIFDSVDAAVFEQESISAANEIFRNKDVAIVTGGTGLYVKVFCEGIDDIPKVDNTIRTRVQETWKNEGLKGLQNLLEKVDPVFYSETLEKNNRARLMRALEVKLGSGRSILEFQAGKKQTRDFVIRKIGIEWPREQLYARINQRVDIMMEQGLLQEAEALFPHRHLKALQTVGYQELFDHFEGQYSLEQAIEKIKQHTRNYAKRQITWFRKDSEIKWMNYESVVKAASELVRI